MIGLIVLTCHLSFSTMKAQCDWVVKQTFDTVEQCQTYESGYTLSKSEQFSNCDEVEPGAKAGDKRPALVLKK